MRMMYTIFHFFSIACGHIFCDACTPHRAIVPLLDIKTPERVCDHCYNKLQHEYNQASSLRGRYYLRQLLLRYFIFLFL